MSETSGIVIGNVSENGAVLELAFKYSDDKPRLDLLDPDFIEGLGKVSAFGSGKYDESKKCYQNNWRQGGMRWGEVFAACMRHLWAYWRGEDNDPESGLSHLYHAGWNVMALGYYARRARHLDDRDHAWRVNPKIYLDLDGVIAGWSQAIIYRAQKLGLGDRFPLDESEVNCWNFFDRELWSTLFPTMADYELFLVNDVQPMCKAADLTFEPAGYVTHRPNMGSHIVKQWLENHGFPLSEIVVVEDPKDKVAELKRLGCEVFVEDKYSTFVECNNAGILCYLIDRARNRKYDVGEYRIKNLNEIITRRL